VSEESWNAARLIPTSGIGGAQEQERRATSALLAVMSAVKEFGRVVVAPFGAPAGALECFVEVPFEIDGRTVFPDGLLRAKRGVRTWTALVEVKTGQNELAVEQVETYLDVARAAGFDCVITISNEIPPAPGLHPLTVDKRKLRKVALHHVSWTELLTQAVLQKEFRGVADPDQAWILGELIRYLEHPKSGAMSFDDMGGSWVKSREAVASGTLRANDPHAAELVSRFDALIRFACLHLGRQLGTEVTPVQSRQEMSDPQLRLDNARRVLVADGVLRAQLRIPRTVSPMAVAVDLRSGQIECSFTLDAPAQGRPATRVNWLSRQLRDAPDTLRIEAFASRARTGAAALLKEAREDPGRLILDPTRELKSFVVTALYPMGTKRGRGRGSFIDSVVDAVEKTYGEVGQHLKGWSAAPPKLRSGDDVVIDTDKTSSTALSSQDAEGSRSAPSG
jgi:hypothetical protein